jgi:hypothetical protein
MEGKLLRVAIGDRRVSTFTVVPKSLGGGGSVWGWGGAAYSARQDALFVVTGNAFEGGTNSGSAFSESAGYGEHLVELSRDLRVLAANHPSSVQGTDDFDFAGSPVIFTPAGCDEVVGAVNKDGRLFLWHANAIADGPFADVLLQKESEDAPLLTQPAYDAATRSVYVATFPSLARVSLDGCSAAHVAWRAAFPHATLQGSPTVAAPGVRREVGAGRRGAAVRRTVLRAAEHCRGPALRGSAPGLRHVGRRALASSGDGVGLTRLHQSVRQSSSLAEPRERRLLDR